MTHANLPHTPEAGTPRAVQTNGEGNATTAHLNLTVDMTGQVSADVERHDRVATNTMERRMLRQIEAQA